MLVLPDYYIPSVCPYLQDPCDHHYVYDEGTCCLVMNTVTKTLLTATMYLEKATPSSMEIQETLLQTNPPEKCWTFSEEQSATHAM